MDTSEFVILVILCVGGLLWYGRVVREGFDDLDQDLEQALRRERRRLRAQDIEADKIIRRTYGQGDDED